MPTTAKSDLGRLLLVDAATCAAMSALLVVATEPLAQLMAIPAELLFWAGALLCPVAAFMAWVGLQRPVPIAAARLIVLGNVGWIAASRVLLAGVLAPNALGTLFVLGQAAVVVLLTWFEFRALPKARPA